MSENLKSEEVILSAPMSFSGSAQRIWRMTKTNSASVKIFIVPLAIGLILTMWAFVATWYAIFGIFLIPFRLLRRSSRKQKRDNLRHREALGSSE